jgi:riboflavin kinase/FMN adenylyltransferase
VVVLAFDPPPRTLLIPGHEPPALTTFEQRAEILRSLGADEVHRLTPTRDLLDLEPEQFARRLIEDHNPIAVVEGSDFHFGRDRGGDVHVLARIGDELGFRTEVVDPVTVVLEDHVIVTASSTITRWLVANGRVRDTARVLGRPYELIGEVSPGDRRGRTIGFPTANIHPRTLLPRHGVYAGLARLDDGRAFPAAVNVGARPTFNSTSPIVEAHLLDAPTTATKLDGLDEYGWRLRIELLGWIRDQIGFPTPEALMGQLERDCRRVRRIVCDRSPNEEVVPCP